MFETLFEHAPVGFALIDRAYRYVRVNEALARIANISIDAHIGRTAADVTPAMWRAVERDLHRVFEGETLVNREVSLPGIGDDSPPRLFLSSYYPIRDGAVISGCGVIVVEITERRRVREALHLRTKLYEMVARTSRAVAERRTQDELFHDLCRIAVETGEFKFVWIGVPNRGRLEPVASAGIDNGYLGEVEVSLDANDPLSHGPSGRAAREGSASVVNDFFASAATRPWHEAARRVGFAASAAFPLTQHGRVVAVLTLYSDQRGFFTPVLQAALEEIVPAVSFALDAIAAERQREWDDAALRMRDRAISAASEGISITDPSLPDNPIIYVSPGFEAVTGYTAEECLGRNMRFLIGMETDQAVMNIVRDALRNHTSATVELINYKKGGTKFWNRLTISPVTDAHGRLTQWVGVLSDVSERRRLEEEFRQAQKMEAVGQLAGGVAHDFNNVLTVIGACSELLLEELGDEPERRELVTEIKRASERASTLTRQLLAFSRKQVLAPRILSVNDLIADAEKLLKRLIGEHLVLATDYATPLWPVKADPGQLEQVLVNLAVNARDAMPDGGTLRITTHGFTASERTDLLPPGDYVVIEVSDTGVGMDDETRHRVFEPFFTTKAIGKGTGLGLATVRTIVDQAHGIVTVDSMKGRGTTFRVYLPRVDGTVGLDDESASDDSMPRGVETLLLVEDDEAVRGIARRVLQSCGYTVLEAGDGREAVAIAARAPGTIDLLVTDVVLPKMGGRQLSETMLALRPQIRVLFVSGYTDDEVIHHGVIEAEVAFLQKPYSVTALAQSVRAVLDSAGR
jgi:PAS domain S-box-containing protein